MAVLLVWEISLYISDGIVKSWKINFHVIPAKAGIQSFQMVTDCLDSGFRRSDDLLRVHHFCFEKIMAKTIHILNRAIWFWLHYSVLKYLSGSPFHSDSRILTPGS